MSYPDNHKKNIKVGSYYLMANIFEKAIAFFVLPIFTKLLTTNDYGLASTYSSYVSIISVFICLSLGNSLRGAIVDYKENIEEYLVSVMVLEIIVAILFSVPIIILGRVLLQDQYVLLAVLCPAHSFFSCIISMISQRYMLERKYIRRTILAVGPPLLSIAMSLLFIVNMNEQLYMGRILGIFVVYACFGVSIIIYVILKNWRLISTKYWPYALKFSTPLVFHGLSLIILNQMDRVMLTSMNSASETGIYSVAYNFGTVAIAFTNTMNDVWVPWFNDRMMEKNTNIIASIGKRFTWTCATLSCGVMLLSPDMFKLFTNEVYWSGILVIPLLVIGNYFSSISGLPINTMYYSKKTNMIAVSSVVAMLVNLCANYCFIPKYGAIGAAFATLCSYFVLFMMQYLSVRKDYKNLFNWCVFVPQSVAVTITTIVVFILLDKIWLRWILAFCAAGLFIYFAVKKWNINLNVFKSGKVVDK